MSARPDPLRGLSSRQRLLKEREDAKFLQKQDEVKIKVQPEARHVADMTYAGHGFDPKRLNDYTGTEPLEAIICARLDLEHPLYFADNLITRCADCDCDLQVRPHAPKGVTLCLSCCAERVRAKLQDGKL